VIMSGDAPKDNSDDNPWDEVLPREPH